MFDFFTGGPDDLIADREVADINRFGPNDSSYMLAGSLVGGGGNGDGGGGNIGGGSGVLGGKSGEGGHAPLRRPRVSPTTSLFMASRGRSPSSTRSESKTGKSPLPRYGIDICTVCV